MTEGGRVPLGIELELLAGLEDFLDPLLGARARLELQELACQVDPRTIGGVDAGRRAAPGQHGHFVAGDAAEKLVHEAALAEARLRGDCDDLPMSRARSLETLSEMSKLQRSSDESGRPAQQPPLER